MAKQAITLTEKINGISSEAVQAKTGKTWPEWVAVLDKAGGQKMTHQQIVAYLRAEHGLGDWWQQMVTGGYEKAAKGRVKGEMPNGFQVGANKTIAASAAALFKHWRTPAARARWLAEDALTITTATPSKSIRAKWGKGGRVNVHFWPKGETKTLVSVEHSQLKNAREAAKQKKFWAAALNVLKELVENA